MEENFNNLEQPVQGTPEGFAPNPDYVQPVEAPAPQTSEAPQGFTPNPEFAQPAAPVAPAAPAAPAAAPAAPAAPAAVPGKGMGIAAMVLGILGIVFCWNALLGIPCAILGLIFGIVSRSKSKNGMALAGLIMGIVGLIIGVIILIVAIAAVGTVVASFSNSVYPAFLD